MLSVSTAGDRTDYVTLQSYPHEQVAVSGISTRDTSFLRFSGLRITNYMDFGNSHDMAIENSDISPRGVAIRSGATRVTVTGNNIHDIAPDTTGAGAPSGYGIFASGGAGLVTYVTIRDNLISGIRGGDAIQLSSSTNITIEDNEIRDVRPDGPADHSDSIQIMGGWSFNIRGNYIHHADSGLMLASGIWGVNLENNLITNILGYGAYVPDAPYARFANNTFWDNGYGGLILIEDASGPNVMCGVNAVNNIFDRLDASPAMFAMEDYNIVYRGARVGPHDVGLAPRFRDPANGDYRLAPGSPGIDAGTSAGTPTQDRALNERRDEPGAPNTGGGTVPFYDVGALEY